MTMTLSQLVVRDAMRGVLADARGEKITRLERKLAELRAQNATLEKERNHFQDECLRHVARTREMEAR